MSLIGEVLKRTRQNCHPNMVKNNDPYIASVSSNSFKMQTVKPIVIFLISFISILCITLTIVIYNHTKPTPHTHSAKKTDPSSDASMKIANTANTAKSRTTDLLSAPLISTVNHNNTAKVENNNVAKTQNAPPTLSFQSTPSTIPSRTNNPTELFNSKSSTTTKTQADADEFFTLHFLEIQEGRLFKALVALNGIAKDKEFFISNIIRICDSLRDKNKFQESKTVIKAGLDHYPNDLVLVTQLASTHLGAHEYNESIKLLEKYTPDFETNPEYYALLAYSYLKVNRTRESVNIYKQLVMFDSTNAPWWIGLAIAYQNKSEPKLALDAYRHALRVSYKQSPHRPFIKAKISEISQGQIL